MSDDSQEKKIVAQPQFCVELKMGTQLTRSQRGDAWQDRDWGELACMPHRTPCKRYTEGTKNVELWQVLPILLA